MSAHRLWPDSLVEKAIGLHDAGLSWREVSLAIGRTQKATSGAVWRYMERDNPALKDTGPIAICKERRAYERNARIGSRQLLAEINRVFGQQRMAA